MIIEVAMMRPPTLEELREMNRALVLKPNDLVVSRRIVRKPKER